MIELECAHIERINDNVIHAKYKDGVHIEMEDAHQLIDAYETLAKGDKIFSLADLTNGHVTFADGVQEHIAKDADFIRQGNVIATAVALKTLGNRMIARFFMTIHRPSYPMKIVASKEAALKYFDTFRD